MHHSSDADTLIWSDTYKAHIVEDIFQGVGLFFPYAYKLLIQELESMCIGSRILTKHRLLLGQEDKKQEQKVI
jgi:DNA-directed RNA polymerase beta subunit